MIYVASSWRNPMFDAVCAALTAAGLEHYNFKKAGAGEGFHWREVAPWYDDGHLQSMHVVDYLNALQMPRTIEGFHSDFDAMNVSDTCVLILPCGRSAHLELGWMVGQAKRTAILLDPDVETDHITPELMYLMVDYLAPTVFDLLGWLGVKD